jgi:hypothetical protein
MRDGVKISGFLILFIGVGVLLFTFYNAYLLLMNVLEIQSSGPLMDLFGDALAPLVTSGIRALYLGVMGWIGSILTRRGVQTVTSGRGEREAKAQTRGKEGS